MEKSRDMFRAFIESMLKAGAFNNFNNVNNDLSIDKRNKEEFEMIKGDYKTVVTVYFTEHGYPVTISSKSEKINNQEDLQKKLDDAVEHEDYQKAADIQLKLKELG